MINYANLINYGSGNLSFRSQTLHPAKAGFRVAHYVRNNSTGLAMAALIAWKLTVINAINMAMAPATKNVHQPIFAQ